jgi:hypothetical protein
MAKALVELSMNRLLWQVRNLVPVIAVKGDVVGVKLDVYTAEVTYLKLEIYPLKELPPNATAPTNIVVEVKFVELLIVVPTFPFM